MKCLKSYLIQSLLPFLFTIVLACDSSEDSTPPVACDGVCLISNGLTAEAATTYWRVPRISCGQLTCYTQIAFYADGTGKMVSETNNCVLGSTPNTISFTWVKTGSQTMLFSNTTLTCSPDERTTAGIALTSFTSITGSIEAGTFSAKFNGVTDTTASLVAGTL